MCGDVDAVLAFVAIALDLVTFSVAKPLTLRLRRCEEFTRWGLNQYATLVLLLTALPSSSSSVSPTAAIDTMAIALLVSVFLGLAINFVLPAKSSLTLRANQILLSARAALLFLAILASFTEPGLAVNISTLSTPSSSSSSHSEL